MAKEKEEPKLSQEEGFRILEDDSVSVDDKLATILKMEPNLTMSKDELKKELSEAGDIEGFIAFVRGMNNLQEDFAKLMSVIQQHLGDFQDKHPLQLTVMGLFSIEGYPGNQKGQKGPTYHCITNIPTKITEDNMEQVAKDQAHIVNILYQNCKMSRVFRDVVVGTYHCLEKAGIANGMYAPEEKKNARKK